MEFTYFCAGIILCTLINGIVVYKLVAKLLEEQKDNLKISARIEQKKLIDPMRIQAYERCIILLERIRPQALVMRVYKGGMNARFTQTEFVRTIREEFNHNMSQQLYVSDNAWSLLVLAREEIVQLIQVCSQDLSDTDSGGEFSKKLMATFHMLEKSPIDEAISFLKQEMNKRY
tara:strand:- start:7235 stop:7756 length:522 start_codon:yes stop_codon:yes gene_type:complete